MADASVSAEHAASLHLLDGPTPADESLLWTLQHEYYNQLGVQPWVDNVVPSFVSSNAFVANSYARVILAFLRDWFNNPRCNRTQPVHIIEVGAGCGRLAFLVVRELFEAWQSWPDLGCDAQFAVDSQVAAHETRTAMGVECAFVAGAPEPRLPGPPRVTGHGPATFGHGPQGRRAPFRYILTDISPETISFLRAHECFAPYIEAGVVDFGVWDADTGMGQTVPTIVAPGTPSKRRAPAQAVSGIPLQCTFESDGRSSTVLRAGTLLNPVVSVATYTFDSLRQAVFKLTSSVDGSGKALVHRGRMALYSDHAPDMVAVQSWREAAASGGGLPALDPALPQRVRVLWSYEPIPAGAALHKDASVEAVVRAYAALPAFPASGCVVTVPVGGLSALRNLRALCKGTGSVFCLLGDKAYAYEQELLVAGGQPVDPHVAMHGSVSFMLNLHALQLACHDLSGTEAIVLKTPYHDGYKCAALWLDGKVVSAGTPECLLALMAAKLAPSAVSSFPNTLFAWADTMDTFGPDQLATLQKTVFEELPQPPVGPGPSLKLALATIRTACWDPDVAFKFRQTLIERAPNCDDRLGLDLYSDVQQIYRRYYPLSPSRDMAFELGRVCMGLRRHREAAALFWASVRHTGEHHVTLYNIGICLFHLGDDYMRGALLCFNRSIALNPAYADAGTWKQRALAKLQAESAPTDADHTAHGHSHAHGGHGHSHA